MHAWFSVILAVAACSSHDPPTSASSATPTTKTTRWSDERAGLRVRVELPDAIKAGTASVVANLDVRNDSTKPIRIILVRPEVFRLHTSTLRVWQGTKVVSLQPEPHPHGYLMEESDFLVIAPNETKRYQQTLSLSGELAKPGMYEVEFMFENSTKRWPGGVNTLDGLTKPLFGGIDVADLWIGKLSVRRPLKID